jgi:hypothetical protein
MILMLLPLKMGHLILTIKALVSTQPLWVTTLYSHFLFSTDKGFSQQASEPRIFSQASKRTVIY